MPEFWLVTASPMKTVAFITTVRRFTATHPDPSLDVSATIWLPLRVNRSHVGAVPGMIIENVVPPLVNRSWLGMPFTGVTNTPAYGDPGSVDSRIITPAFAQAEVFC